jgi:hypothetical protein
LGEPEDAVHFRAVDGGIWGSEGSDGAEADAGGAVERVGRFIDYIKIGQFVLQGHPGQFDELLGGKIGRQVGGHDDSEIDEGGVVFEAQHGPDGFGYGRGVILLPCRGRCIEVEAGAVDYFDGQHLPGDGLRCSGKNGGVGRGDASEAGCDEVEQRQAEREGESRQDQRPGGIGVGGGRIVVHRHVRLPDEWLLRNAGKHLASSERSVRGRREVRSHWVVWKLWVRVDEKSGRCNRNRWNGGKSFRQMKNERDDESVVEHR